MSESQFQQLCNIDSDINLHLNTLRYYASQSKTIVEMGVRWVVSTWAFLEGHPKKLTSYDIVSPEEWKRGDRMSPVEEYAKENNIDFKFILQDVLTVKLPKTDLLFIDTWHVYDQLIQELNMHSSQVNKWIILHDTETFGEKGENSAYSIREKKEYLGLKYAVNEFLQNNADTWRLHEHYTFCNGLTILKRIGK